MIVALAVLLAACSSSEDTEYTRTTVPMGVTDGDTPQPPEDTGSDTGAP